MRKRSFLSFLTVLLFGASALAGCTLPTSSSSSASSSTSSSSIQSSTSSSSSSSVSSASSDSSSSSVDSSTSSSPSSSSSSSSSSATQPLEVAFELDLDDAKVTFAYGEAFAATGLAVYGVYDDDSRVLVETNQYTVAAPTYQATLPGTYPVNITYKTYPVQHYDVTVAAKVEDGFIIDHSAIDKTLDYGQALDLTPLLVHATYVVGDDEVLSTGYTIDNGGFSATTPGTYTITVSYQTYTAQTFQVTVADKIENGFELDTSLVVTDLAYGQLLNTDPLKVYATYAVGERELLPTSAYQIRLGSYAYNNPGVHDIIVAYSTYPDQTFQVTVGEPEEVRFGIDDSAVDHMLDYGQELDLTPLNVFTFNQIDEPTPLLSGYTIDQGGFSATTPGTYTITVSYQTYDTQSFQVVVNEPVENGFTIDTSNAPQAFAYGEPFDATGLLVYATYAVGEDTLLSPGDFMIDIGGYDKFVPGSYTITIAYGSYPDQTYTVTVLEAEPVAIEIDSTLVEKNLVKGSGLDYSSLKVYLVYADDHSEEVLKSDYTVDLSGFNKDLAGDYVIIVTHSATGFTGSFPVHVYEQVENGYYLNDILVQKDFAYGEAFNATGLEVYVTYDVGNPRLLLPSEYTIDDSQYHATIPGTYTISVLFQSFTPVQTYMVTVAPQPIVLDDIILDTTDMVLQIEGENLVDYNPLHIYAHYSDDSQLPLNHEDVEFSFGDLVPEEHPTLGTIDRQTITITYLEMSATFDFIFYTRTVTGFTLDASDSQYYFLSPVTDISAAYNNVTCTLHYNDGVTESCDSLLSEFTSILHYPAGTEAPLEGDPYPAGIYTIEYQYDYTGGTPFIDFYTFEVLDDTVTVTSISLDTSNLLLQIPYGADFMPSFYQYNVEPYGQLIVTVHLSNGVTYEVDDYGINFPGYSNTTVGMHTVSVYWGTSVDPATFSIEVLPETPSVDLKVFEFEGDALEVDEFGVFHGSVYEGTASFHVLLDFQYSQASYAWTLDGAPVTYDPNGGLISFESSSDLIYTLTVWYGEGEGRVEQIYLFHLHVIPEPNTAIYLNDNYLTFDPEPLEPLQVMLPRGDIAYSLDVLVDSYYQVELHINFMKVDPFTYSFELSDAEQSEFIEVSILDGTTIVETYSLLLYHDPVVSSITINGTPHPELSSIGILGDILLTTYQESLDFNVTLDAEVNPDNYSVLLYGSDPTTGEWMFLSFSNTIPLYVGSQYFHILVINNLTGLVADEYAIYITYDPDISFADGILINDEYISLDGFRFYYTDSLETSLLFEVIMTNPDYSTTLWGPDDPNTPISSAMAGTDLYTGVSSILNTPRPYELHFTDAFGQTYKFQYWFQRDNNYDLLGQFEAVEVHGYEVTFEPFGSGVNYGTVLVPFNTITTETHVEIIFGEYASTTIIADWYAYLVDASQGLFLITCFDEWGNTLGYMDIVVTDVFASYPTSVLVDMYELVRINDYELFLGYFLEMPGRPGIDPVGIYVTAFNPLATVRVGDTTVNSGERIDIFPVLGLNVIQAYIELNDQWNTYEIVFFVTHFRNIPSVYDTGISLDLDMVSTTIAQGDNLILDDLHVYVTDSNSESHLVLPGNYEIDLGSFDSNVPNTYTITVSYQTFSATFEVTVTAALVPDYLQLDLSDPALDRSIEEGTMFNPGMYFQPSGGFGHVGVELYYIGGDYAILTPMDFTFSCSTWGPGAGVGTYFVTVEYPGATSAQFSFEIVAAAPSVELQSLYVEDQYVFPDSSDFYHAYVDPTTSELYLEALPVDEDAILSFTWQSSGAPLSYDEGTYLLTIPVEEGTVLIQLTLGELHATYPLVIHHLNTGTIVQVNGVEVTFDEGGFAYVELPRESNTYTVAVNVADGYFYEIYLNYNLHHETDPYQLASDEMMQSLEVHVYVDAGGEPVETYYCNILRESVLAGFNFNGTFYDGDTYKEGFHYDILHSIYTDQLTITPVFVPEVNPEDYEVIFFHHIENMEFTFPMDIYVDQYFMMVMVTHLSTNTMVEHLDLMFEYDPGILFFDEIAVNGEFYTYEEDRYFFIDANTDQASLSFAIQAPEYDFAFYDASGTLLSTDPNPIFLYNITNSKNDFMAVFSNLDHVYRFKLSLQRYSSWWLSDPYLIITVQDTPIYYDYFDSGDNYGYVRLPAGGFVDASDFVLTYNPYELGADSHSYELIAPNVHQFTFYQDEIIVGIHEVEVLWTDPYAVLYVGVSDEGNTYELVDNEEAPSVIEARYLVFDGFSGTTPIELDIHTFDMVATSFQVGETIAPCGTTIALYPVTGENTYTILIHYGETTVSYELILHIEAFQHTYYNVQLNDMLYPHGTYMNSFEYDTVHEVFVLNNTIQVLPDATTISFTSSDIDAAVSLIPSDNSMDPTAVAYEPYTLDILVEDATFGTHARYFVVIDSVMTCVIVPVEFMTPPGFGG